MQILIIGNPIIIPIATKLLLSHESGSGSFMFIKLYIIALNTTYEKKAPNTKQNP